MKKLLFVVVLFLLCPVIVFGENFEIKEYGITMSFDKNWDVFTRESDRNDYFLVKYDLDYDFLQNSLKRDMIYLYAINEIGNDTKIEFMVITNGKKVEVSRPMNLEEFKEYASIVAQKYGADDYKIYENNYKYIKYDYYDENAELYCTKYLLYIDSVAYFFTARKEVPFKDEEIILVENVIDSIAISGDGIQYVEGSFDDEVQETKGFNYQRFIINFIVSFLFGIITWTIVNKYILKKYRIKR